MAMTPLFAVTTDFHAENSGYVTHDRNHEPIHHLLEFIKQQIVSTQQKEIYSRRASV